MYNFAPTEWGGGWRGGGARAPALAPAWWCALRQNHQPPYFWGARKHWLLRPHITSSLPLF